MLGVIYHYEEPEPVAGFDAYVNRFLITVNRATGEL